MVVVGPNLEREEVAEVEACGLLQPLEHALGRAHEAKVDVLRRAGPRQPQLEHEAAFEHGGVTERVNDAGQETIEDEKLPPSSQVGPRPRRRPQTLLDGLLERGR